MDKNETTYELKLDAKEFIGQLQQIRNALEDIGRIVTQQSGHTYAIDVQIKNADFVRFFERVNKAFERSGKTGKEYSEIIENEIGKAFKGTVGKAQEAVKGYEGALKTSTKRITKVANDTAQSISDVYEKQDAHVVKYLNRYERRAKESAQKITGEFSNAFRAMKQDLEKLGMDTSNMSVRDIEKFWNNANARFNKRQTSQELTRNFRESLEKTANVIYDRMGRIAEKNAEKQGRMLEATANKEVKEEELAQERINKIREAALEKERQRILRQRLYRQNVAEASRMLQQQIAETNAPEEQKLRSQYNRAVARIRGIYQSAVEHGRVENPETILAGLTELQQRSLALNNYRLSEQMGINDLNEKLKTTVRRFEEMGTRWNKFSSVIQNSVQAFATIQSFATRITTTFISFSRNVLTRISSQVRTLVSESTEAFKSLEVSLIGFKNFFGEEATDRLYQRIKNIAAKAPGLATTDLADYVRQIAPVSGHNADLALNASLGMLKTIQYGGASGSTEMEYVIKNIRDVLAKGKATAIDIRQFNRAMPILEEVLGSVGQSQLLKDGVLTINKDNVDTILSAFAALNNSNQSAVKDIFSQMNQTLAGQWEQFREQFTTNLMEALRGSQVYGGAQNLLAQLNSGEYVNSGLRRLQEALANFINNINWFKLQRIAGEIWDGMKIIWEGVEDAAKNIVEALGKTRSGNVISSFSKWIADLIRGLSDGVVQVIKFIQYLERSGIMNNLSRIIGWFGSVGAVLTRVLGTMFSHLTNIAGNIMQLVGRYTKLMTQSKLASLTQQLDAIPITARSQVASGADLLYGTGAASTTPEVSAINNLASIVNSHLTRIEMNQTGKDTLPKVSYARNNGKNFLYSEDYQGYEAVGTWNAKTQSWDMHGFSNRGEGAAEYQRLTTQNRLQASNSAFLQRVGSNKYVDATLKWIKSAGAKILAFTQKLIGNLMQGGIALMVTQSITGIIESLDLFGDATVYIAGVIKSAGYAIAGALVGRTFGTAGGVVGALVGLGVGIAQLVDAVQKKADEMTNVQIQKALDEEQKNIFDSVKDALIKNGALEADLGKRSNEENYALQQLANVIANSSTMELEKLGSRGLADVYGDALRYKTIQENFTNVNEGLGYDWTQHATGRTVTKNDKEYLKMIYDAVNKYDLLASHGYQQAIVDGRRVYVDSNGSPISAETIWDEFFSTQEGLDTVTSGQIEDMQVYLEKQEQEQLEWWKEIEKKLEGISNTPGMTWYDLIDSRLREANQHLLAIQAQNPTKESMTAIYGSTAGNSYEKYKDVTNPWGSGTANGSSQERLRTYENYYSGGYTSPLDRWSISQVEGRTAMPDSNNSKLKALVLWASSNHLEPDALTYDLTGDEIDRLYDLLSGDWRDRVGVDKILNQLSGDLATTNNAEKRAKMFDALADISGFQMTDSNILWWLRLLLKQEKMIGDYRFFAHGGLLTPAYRGVDTVPAMLSPGEFVMKQSAVKKAGLGMMYALNRGDLGAAARSLAGNVNNNWYRNNNASINNSRNTKTNINNFRIYNRNASARMNTYMSLANRLSF